MNIKEIDYDLKLWGIVLIVMGVISGLATGFLDATWGYVLIYIGAISLYIKELRMYLLLGAMFLVVGLSNTIFGSSGWSILGIVQLWIGFTTFRSYWTKR